MAYAAVNFKSKKALKDAVNAGQKIEIYNPGLGQAPTEGKAYLEGPHYPAAHSWYAEVEVSGGVITKVIQ